MSTSTKNTHPSAADAPSCQTYKPGHRWGQLTPIGHVEGKPHRIICRCDCGEVKNFDRSNLDSGRTKSCRGTAHRAAMSYAMAHYSVRMKRGKASAYPCWRECGKQGAEWAYDHADPNERPDEDGPHAGLPYSTDPMHYVPQCRTCHRRFDATTTQILRITPAAKASPVLARIWSFLHDRPGMKDDTHAA